MGNRLPILVLALAAACATPANKEVTTSDGPVLYPTARVAVSFLPKSVSEGKDKHGVGEIEVDLTGTWGDGQQQLDAGERIRVGDFTRAGPATLNIDYTLFQAAAVARGGWRVKNWEFLGFAGLGYIQSEIKVDDGVDGGRIKDDAVGPVIGLQVAWEPLKRLDVYGRAGLLLATDVDSQQAELGVGYRVFEQGRLFLAYRWWRYEFEPDSFTAGTGDDLTNHIDLRTNGFVLGLEVRF
jgi:hypothetical protein